MLKTRLELHGGFEVLAAEDSEKGCRLAATEHPDVILIRFNYKSFATPFAEKNTDKRRSRLLCVLLIRFGAVSADPTSRPRIQRYTKTGVFVCVSTLFVTLPSTTAASPPRPCDPMTMRSQPLSEAAAIMA